MPDALSKTVPLWCAVINRAIKAKYRIQDNWDTSLYTPPGVVSVQEHSQIDHLLDQWANQLLVSVDNVIKALYFLTYRSLTSSIRLTI